MFCHIECIQVEELSKTLRKVCVVIIYQKKQKELEKSYLGLFSHFDAYKLSQKIIFKHEIQGETL